MMDVPPPIIGAINGVAYGGGTEFVLLCDFAYGATHSRYALTEVTLGIMPGAGATQMLPRAVGLRRAKEFLMCGAPCSAEEALEWGILNKVCEPDKLMDEALARRARSPRMRRSRSGRPRSRSTWRRRPISGTATVFEIEAYNRMVPTEDRMEGIRAFNEKRKPIYKGQ